VHAQSTVTAWGVWAIQPGPWVWPKTLLVFVAFYFASTRSRDLHSKRRKKHLNKKIMYVWYKRNLYYTMTNIDSGFSAPPTHHPSRYQESKKRATPCRGTIATTSALARANVRSRSNLRHLANTISYLQPRAQSGRCAGGLMSYRSVLPQRHFRRCPFWGVFTPIPNDQYLSEGRVWLWC